MSDLTPEEFLEKFGYPLGVAESEMTADQGRNYWKHHSRKHEREKLELQRAGSTNTPPEDYEELKTQAAAYKKWQEENETEQQKAIKAARDEGRNEALATVSAQSSEKLVGLALSLSLKDKFSAEEIKEISEGINAKAYVDANGDLNVDRLTSFVAKFGGAPKEGQENQNDNQKDGQDAGGSFQTGPGANGQGRTGDVQNDPWAEGAARAKAQTESSVGSVKIPGQIG